MIYGFRGDDVFKDVAVLFSGERVAIVILSLAKANFLLLAPMSPPISRAQLLVQDTLAETREPYFDLRIEHGAPLVWPSIDVSKV